MLSLSVLPGQFSSCLSDLWWARCSLSTEVRWYWWWHFQVVGLGKQIRASPEGLTGNLPAKCLGQGHFHKRAGRGRQQSPCWWPLCYLQKIQQVEAQASQTSTLRRKVHLKGYIKLHVQHFRNKRVENGTHLGKEKFLERSDSQFCSWRILTNGAYLEVNSHPLPCPFQYCAHWVKTIKYRSWEEGL